MELRGDLNPTDHGSLTSEYARKSMTERDSRVLDVPQDSLIFHPLGLKAQRLSRSVSGPPCPIWGPSLISIGRGGLESVGTWHPPLGHI